MDINQSNINEFLNKYIRFVDELSLNGSYPNNVRHVLYLIIPSFVLKYGLKYENMILNCFRETPIYINDKQDDHCTAFFGREMKVRNELPKYYTRKFVVLNQYTGSSLLDMLDNVIHEFNHAVNSMINEINYDEKEVSMRTGLSYITYSVSDLTKPIRKSSDITLEEIINVKQTEDIINIIASFAKYNIHNQEFNNALYSINSEIKGEFTSNAYYLQSFICKELMKNKTFIPTIENLRLNGNVSDIENWFNGITGEKNSYKKLTTLLDEILRDEEKLTKVKWFKNYHINKIRNKMSIVMEIVKLYEDNCIFK